MRTDPFRTPDHVADFDGYVTACAALNAQTRARLPMVGDVAYGDGPDERLDLVLPAAEGGPHPVRLFVHGGYWRMFAMKDFSFVARTVTAAGAIAAVMDYSPMPGIQLSTLVGQVRRAAAWLHANADHYGGDPERLAVSGHSAGAHLSTFLLRAGEAPLRAAVLLSGVYHLQPLRASFLEPLIGLTDEDARAFSPLAQDHATGGPLHVLVRAEETAPFQDQAVALGELIGRDGLDVTTTVLPRTNHMSAVLDLGTPETTVGQLLGRIIGGEAQKGG